MHLTPKQRQLLPQTATSCGWRLASPITALAIAAWLIGAAGATQAGNILSNPGFEANTGQEVPTGWTLFSPESPGMFFFIPNGSAEAHSGNHSWKQWVASNGGAGDVAGIYQDQVCAGGWTYEADGWFFTPVGDTMGAGNKAWVEVSFRDTSDNMIALYKTAEFTAAWGNSTWFDLKVTNVCDISISTYPVTNTVSQLVAPEGTSKVRYRIVHFRNTLERGSFCLDDASLDQLTAPCQSPVIGEQPRGQTNLVNSLCSFSVTATGTAPQACQWRFNGTEIDGATGTNLALSNVQFANAGDYTVVVTNICGSVTSAVATLTVLGPPSITQQPVSLTVTQGQTANFTVTASGTSPLSYQWRFQASPIAGATESSFTVNTAQASNAGPYSVVVANALGAITSSVAVLTVGIPPAITQQPVSLTVTQGQNAVFSVTAVGSNPLGYQWRLGGTDIAGATQRDYTVVNAQAEHAGPYAVVVTNAYGAQTSAVARLTVRIPPLITQQPTNRIVLLGEGTVFHVGATGDSPLGYQWFKDGAPIAGARFADYQIPSVQLADTGDYFAVVINAVGTVTSAVARLEILGVPRILVDGQVAMGGSVTRPESAQISMETDFPNGSIFYTLDGTEPSFGSDMYDGPFTLTSSATVRAIAYNEDFSEWLLSASVGVIVLPTYTLMATTAGGGTISLNPPTGPYMSNTTVSVTATPDPGWTFLYWTGDAAGTNNPVAVTMNGPRAVQAVFGTTVNKTVVGQGAVVLDPPQGPYPYASSVRLSAVPTNGYYFVRWANTSTSTVSPLTIAVTKTNQTFTALFSSLPANRFALTLLANGHGSVTAVPAKNMFTNGEVVTLTASPDALQAFDSWSGNASGTENPLSLVMSQSRVITGNFSLAVAPTITAQPQGQAVAQGATFALNVTVTGSAPRWYQWYQAGAVLAGETNSSLTITNAQAPQIGNYFVTVSNAYGGVTSEVAVVNVLGIAPSITQQPVSLTMYVGWNAGFAVTAQGSSPLSYQWRKETAILSGAIAPTYSIMGGQTTQTGTYTVVVTNSYGSVTSSPVALIVKEALPAGQVVAWGGSGGLAAIDYGQAIVPDSAQSGVIAIAAGAYQTAALKHDGMLLEWGRNDYGQTTVPAGLSNIMAFSAGDYHTLAVKSDGTLRAWGRNDVGQSTVPEGLGGLIGVAAGRMFSVALKSDGTVVAWGDNENGQTTVPAGLRGVIAIAAGWSHVVALKNDGAVVSWGYNYWGETAVPPGLSGVVAISAGVDNTAALKSDGTAVAWGYNAYGQSGVPADLANLKAIATGGGHTLAVKSNTLMVAWGYGESGATTVPRNLCGVTAVAAGDYHSVALVMPCPPIIITNHPQDQTAGVGSNATFSVGATGDFPFYYQWRKEGANIAGAQAASFTLTNVQMSDWGNYDVVITNGSGSVTSMVAKLTFLACPDSFNPGASSAVNSMVVQADGKILVGGLFTSLGGQSRNYFGRLNVDGTLDGAFNPGASGIVNCLAVQADGKILVGGLFQGLSGQIRKFIGRVNANGTLDTTFNPGASTTVNCIAIQSDGKILVGGSFTTLGGQPRNYLGRLNADGALDTTFNPSPDAEVKSLAVQADGKILVGGIFSRVGGQSMSYLGRLNADGTLDAAFNPNAGGYVNSVVVQADGKIVVAGSFYQLGGQQRFLLGRLNADGALDTAFNANASGAFVWALAIQTDGKIVVGGYLTGLGGKQRNRIGRLHADGTIDSSFDPGASSSVNQVNSLTVQADGKILVGGDFTMLGGQSRSYLVRLNNTDPATQSLTFDGSTITWLRGGVSPEVWRTSFESSTDGITWVSLGSGTRIPGGWDLAADSTPTNATIRVRGFLTGGNFNGSCCLVENSVGHLLVASQPNSLTNVAGTPVTFTVAVVGTFPLWYQWRKDGVNLLGATNASYSIGSVSSADAGNYDVVVTNLTECVTSTAASLTIWVVPVITSQPQSATNLAGTTATFKVDATGTAPLFFQWRKDGTNLNGATASTYSITSVGSTNSGSYDVVITNFAGSVTSAVASLTVLLAPTITSPPQGVTALLGATVTLNVSATGTAPLSYQWRKEGTGIFGGTGTSLAVTNFQSADAGNYDVLVSNSLGSVTSAVAVLTVNLINLDAFNPGANSAVYALTMQTDGKLVVGGSFSTVGGQARSRIGRLNADGTLETAFNPGANSTVNCLAMQPDGKIVVAGSFTTLGGQARNRIGRLNSDGTLDSAFNPGVSNTVNCLTIQADGRILVAGNFIGVAGQARNGIGRLNADGSLDATFYVGGSNSVINSLAIQADGRILVGGTFTTLGGQTRSRIGRLNSDGSLDANFNPGASNTVNAIAVQADGKILVGGIFTGLGGQICNRIGRLNADGSLDVTFNPGASNAVNSLTLQADGRILVAGSFTGLGGQTRNCLGRLNADGSLDTTFNPGAGGTIYCLALQGDGKILAGGSFSTLGGQSRTNLGRWNSSDVATQSLGRQGTTITWLRGGTSPEVWGSTFELSTNGNTWAALGTGTRIPGGWQLASVSTPPTCTLRARGFVAGGYFNGSGWFVETVTDAQLAGPPVVYTQPANQTNVAGATATFNVSAEGTRPLGYQWRKEGGALTDGGGVAGSQLPTLTLSNVLGGDSGGYSVVISNAFGSVTSLVATLSVADPVLIIQPNNQTANVGTTVDFSVGAAGTPPLSYQWRKDGSNLAGATAASMTLNNAQWGDRGGYDVVVTSGYGSVTSQVAVLTMISPPTILVQPQSQSVWAGSNVTLTVIAEGTPPFSYQWRLNGAALAGAVSSNLVLTNVQLGHAGAYSVTVTNVAGFITSDPATLTVVSDASRIVRLIGTNAWEGGSLTVPVQMAAQGNENAVGFSVAFDPALLTFTGGALGSGAIGANYNFNTNQAASGKVGLTLAMPTGTTFAMGTQEVARLSFHVPAGVDGISAVLAFANQPIAKEVSDLQAVPLPTTFVDGNIPIGGGYEADVTPLPNGNGAVTITDWVKIGRYAAGLDTLPSASQFQKADCAPRSTQGSGSLTVSDWVQAGRYAAGLDPLTAAGGPTGSLPSPAMHASRSIATTTANLGVGDVENDSIERIIQVCDAILQPGGTSSVPVELIAVGNENALGFSLTFDQSVLGYASVALGSAATGGTINVNTNQLALGRLGIGLTLPVDGTFAAGTQELVHVVFRVATNAAGTTFVDFADRPIYREISDALANPLSATYRPGTLSFGASPNKLLKLLAPDRQPEGHYRLTVVNADGSMIETQRTGSISLWTTTNMLLYPPSWTKLTNPPFWTNGSLLWDDGSSTNLPSRFYRATEP